MHFETEMERLDNLSRTCKFLPQDEVDGLRKDVSTLEERVDKGDAISRTPVVRAARLVRRSSDPPSAAPPPATPPADAPSPINLVFIPHDDPRGDGAAEVSVSAQAAIDSLLAGMNGGASAAQASRPAAKAPVPAVGYD